MIKKLLRQYRDFMNKPILLKINEVNKNINFLVNQTLKMEDIQTMPSIKSIQEKQMDILIRLSRFFDQNGIDYFLTYGTLLGAVRHKGFVPWDDDIDVAVFFEDFPKIIDNESQFKELGLGLSSPFSKENNYKYVGWHKVYDLENKFHISIFTFDIVNTPDIKNFLSTRAKFNDIATQYRTKFHKGKLNFSGLRSRLDDLNVEYFKQNDFVTKATANTNSYIVKNICNYFQPNYSSFKNIYPLQKVDFIVSPEQEITQFPIPQNPDGVLQDFYGKDYMHFPKNVFPIHPHVHNIEN